MEARYHISKKTGRPNLCGATKRGCPLGGEAPHFPTKEAAQDFLLRQAAAEHSTVPAVARKDPVTVALDHERAATRRVMAAHQAKEERRRANEKILRERREADPR